MIMNQFFLFFVSVFFMVIMVISICFQNKHILGMLLSLEGMMLGMFMMLTYSMFCNAFFSLVFLSMIACEASIGLSLMVKYVRTHGNDYVFNMNLNSF